MVITLFMDECRALIAAKNNPPVQPVTKQETERPLIVQMSEWLSQLTDEKREIKYSMEWLEGRFGVDRKFIGPCLVELNFTRERYFDKNKSHRRYWLAPQKPPQLSSW
jgi:hypothetical protein